ncbi:MAG TPA: type II toxin-antitoxin system PrlF family antitoxin [Terriglobia bacterium]|jgi:AbrB family looped-hinge helix DNA binding protein
MPTATLTSKGQTTIPREVREFLKVKSGDKLEFKINESDKTVSLKAVNINVSDLKGLLNRSGMKPYNPAERKLAFKARARRK